MFKNSLFSHLSDNFEVTSYKIFQDLENCFERKTTK